MRSSTVSHSSDHVYEPSRSSVSRRGPRRASEEALVHQLSPSVLKDGITRVHGQVQSLVPASLNDRVQETLDCVPLADYLAHFASFRRFEALAPETQVVDFSFDGNVDAPKVFEQLMRHVLPVNGSVLAVPPGDGKFCVTVAFPRESNVNSILHRLSTGHPPLPPFRHLFHSADHRPMSVGLMQGYPAFFSSALRTEKKLPPSPRGKDARFASRGFRSSAEKEAFPSAFRRSPDIAQGPGVVLRLTHDGDRKTFDSFAKKLGLTVTDLWIHSNTLTAVVQVEGSEVATLACLQQLLNKLVRDSSQGASTSQVLVVTGDIQQTFLGKPGESPKRFSGSAFAEIERMAATLVEKDGNRKPGVFLNGSAHDMTETPRSKTKMSLESTLLSEGSDIRVVQKVREIFNRLDAGLLSEMVGREDEFKAALDFVRAFLDSFAEGNRGVWLEGEPGVGKSRFIREILGVLQPEYKNRATFLYYSSREHHKTEKNFALFHILRDVFGEKLESHVKNKFGIFQDGERFNMDGFANPVEAAATLRSLFKEYKKPVVLCLDDCQWMDQFSANIFALLLQNPPHNLFVIGADRGVRGADEAEHDRTPPVLREQFTKEGSGFLPVELERLDFTNRPELLPEFVYSFFAVRFAPQKFTGETFPQKLLSELALASQGNPLSLKERLGALVDHGVVTVMGGALQVNEGAVEVIRETLTKTNEELYKARFERIRNSENGESLFSTFAWIHAFSGLSSRTLSDILPHEHRNNILKLVQLGLVTEEPLDFSHGELHRAYLGIAHESVVASVAGKAAFLLHQHFDVLNVSSDVVYRLAKEGGRQDLVDRYGIMAGFDFAKRSDNTSAANVLGEMFDRLNNPSAEMSLSQLQLISRLGLTYATVLTHLSRYKGIFKVFDTTKSFIDQAKSVNAIAAHHSEKQFILALLYLHYATNDRQGAMADLCLQLSSLFASEKLPEGSPAWIRSELLLGVYQLRTLYQNEDYDGFFAESKSLFTPLVASHKEFVFSDPECQKYMIEIQRLTGNAHFVLSRLDGQQGDPVRNDEKRKFFDYEQMIGENRSSEPHRREYAEKALAALQPVLTAVRSGASLMNDDAFSAVSAFDLAATLTAYIGYDSENMGKYYAEAVDLAQKYDLPEALLHTHLAQGQRCFAFAQKAKTTVEPRFGRSSFQYSEFLEAALLSFQATLNTAAVVMQENPKASFYALSAHIDIARALSSSAGSDPDVFERFQNSLSAALNSPHLYTETYQYCIPQLLNALLEVLSSRQSPPSSQSFAFLHLDESSIAHLHGWYNKASVSPNAFLVEPFVPFFSVS